MNVNSVITRNYENKSNWTLGENKPNSNPTCSELVEPISNPIKPKQTQPVVSLSNPFQSQSNPFFTPIIRLTILIQLETLA